ncbi:MAG TPA: CPBP family intramembrane glutamate endopeptidase, partial [Terracidiphilus sp.]
MTNGTPIAVALLAIELIPALVFAFAAERAALVIAKWTAELRIVAPAVLVVPYAILAAANHRLRWDWFVVYTVLPVVMAWLLERAALADPEQRGNWRDAIILLILGLTVDLRWFDAAWPTGMRGLGNLLLVDAGLY